MGTSQGRDSAVCPVRGGAGWRRGRHRTAVLRFTAVAVVFKNSTQTLRVGIQSSSGGRSFSRRGVCVDGFKRGAAASNKASLQSATSATPLNKFTGALRAKNFWVGKEDLGKRILVASAFAPPEEEGGAEASPAKSRARQTWSGVRGSCPASKTLSLRLVSRVLLPRRGEARAQFCRLLHLRRYTPPARQRGIAPTLMTQIQPF